MKERGIGGQEANDIGREGRWSWVSSQTPVGGFLWSPEHPGHDTGLNCLVLAHDKDYKGWDNYCDSSISMFYPICQKV